MYKSVCNLAIERSRDTEIVFRLPGGPQSLLRCMYGRLPALHKRFCSITLLFSLQQFIACDGTRGFRGLLQTIEGTLDGGGLSFSLTFIGLGLVQSRFSGGSLRRQF